MKKILATFSLLLTIGLQQTALAESSLKIDSSYKNRECKLAQLNPQTKPESLDRSINFKKPTSTMKVEGGTAELLPPEKSGLPLKTLPGVKTISMEQWAELKSVPKTGLYLVDTEFVPLSLPKELEKRRYTLKKDGTLLNEEKKLITIFIKGEMFRVKPNSISEAGVKSIKSSTDRLYAAYPYPFSAISWSMWWKYRGGFCRDYRAWTTAEAWGPLQGGDRPHTKIQYMETRAQIGSKKDRDSCFNCDNESSYVRWDVGCFWPAHRRGLGYHYANWKDGNISATLTWSW